ncbi:hypothetical protein LTR64_000590 [Lithohypha guttulata]|uniref:uncharacterized protein n=1 Tax=Lithohypha guttulata TaxID=1690604 RepID=UPI002DDE04D3|nr:hypothetical protein LTR51_005644 [Lithohypha guttulata]
MTSLCPNVYKSIQVCANTTTHETSCYCEALIENRCTGLCIAGSQANQYLNYILPECEGVLSNSSPANTTANTSLNFTSSWPDYTNLTDTAYLRLFPWRWDLQSNSLELANGTATRPSIEASEKLGQCPKVQSALVSFAIVNAVVFLASTITANRHVVYFVTCHIFGGKEGGKWWPASALLSVAINLAGNVINALLIIRTPGYRHVPLLPLVLL